MDLKGKEVFIVELKQFGIVKTVGEYGDKKNWVYEVEVTNLKNGIPVKEIVNVVTLTITIVDLIRDNWDALVWAFNKFKNIFKLKK